ncbi:hypothetical protein Bca4012_039547 [Brassica carinata]|uniref:Uncharacterized protein n=1 Tax=Brassica carinata TaxID=52824 RepID=A0A8X8B8K3_BRACI|nr:hypothetical protein Bca52824_007790 [Brassica carinata]
MDVIVVPLRRGSPTYSSGSQSAHCDNVIIPVGTLQLAPCKRDVPKLSPVIIAHRFNPEPLSGLMFTQESVMNTSDTELKFQSELIKIGAVCSVGDLFLHCAEYRSLHQYH